MEIAMSSIPHYKILLFGPTGPSVWAPAGPNVTTIRAPGGNLAILPHDAVQLPPL